MNILKKTIQTFAIAALIFSGGYYGAKTIDFVHAAYQATVQSQIIVQFPSQLAGDIKCGVLYKLDGVIDLGTVEITVPECGLFIDGGDYFIGGLTSTEDNHTMFKDGASNYAGNVRLSNMFMTSSGANSKLFDLDNEENNGAIEFISTNIGDFSDSTTEIGTLANYRQFRTADVGFFRIQDGLTFAGTWSGGFRINDTIVLAQAASSTLFKAGAGLTFGGRSISDINAASVDPTTVTFDFVAENFLLDGGFQLTGASFAPNSAISVTTDETEIKAFFRDNVEIRNTRPGFEAEWTTDTVTPLTQDVRTKALGTTAFSNGTWFSQTANNRWQYDSNLVKDLSVDIDVNVDGGANDQIQIHLMRFDDSEGTFETVKTKTRNISNIIGQLDVALFTFKARVDDMGINDYLEIHIENIDDNTDATIQSGSEIYVEVL